MGIETVVQAAGANRMGQRRHTLLFVDDEPDVIDSLRHQFHRGYRVLGCTSGKEAVQALESDEVDLILSDQRMPGMTGDQLLRRLRRHSGRDQRSQ
jgi:CheY-like chemotaxis protein